MKRSPTLAGVKGIAPLLLGQEPFIAREQGCGTRLPDEAFLRRHGTELKIRMEMGSNAAINQAVAGRLGVCILSRSAVRAELASGEIILLDVPGAPQTASLMC